MFRRLCLKCNALRRLEKFKVHVHRRSKCSKPFDNQSIEDYRFSIKPVLDKYGEKFMEDLDKKMLEKKKLIEVQLGLWRAEGVPNIPEHVSAHNWKVILTQTKTMNDLKIYLKKMHVREVKSRKTLDINITNYNELRQPHEDDDLHIIQRVFSMKKNLSQWNGIQSILHGTPLVIDMAYDSIDEDEKYETARQIEYLYNNNLEHYQPCHLHFTSYLRNDLLINLRQENFMAEFHRKGLMEVFPQDRLFYLVPEADMIEEEEFTENKIFVIGGVGGTSIRRRSLKRAKALGVRYGSLPVDKYVKRKVRSTKDLYIHVVMQIMLDKLAGVPWKLALERHLPDKKFEKFPGLSAQNLSCPISRKSFKQFEVLDKLTEGKENST